MQATSLPLLSVLLFPVTGLALLRRSEPAGPAEPPGEAAAERDPALLAAM